MVADLNLKRRLHEESLAALEQQKAALQEKMHKLEQNRQALELRYKEKLSDAYAEATEIVQETKRQMQHLLDELKKKEKAEGREILKKVRERQAELEEKKLEYASPDEAGVPLDEISEGDSVFVKSLGHEAVVVHVIRPQNRLRVSYGGKEIEMPASGISKSKAEGTRTSPGSVTTPAADEMPVLRLNLIGHRVDEALSELEPFLNHASLSGVTEVTVIHGFGTGALSRAVRDYLKGHPLVKSFRKGEQPEGGGGVTVATMR
jgi:DNA mismatch repair protein MutS2